MAKYETNLTCTKGISLQTKSFLLYIPPCFQYKKLLQIGKRLGIKLFGRELARY